jgi:pyruvate dehydrogenase E1 component
VINVTSARRLYRTLRADRGQQLMDARRSPDLGHLATLIPADERRAPIVTVQDGASHGLAFLGSIFGAPTVPLGVDTWGQSGSRAALYEYAGIDPDEIVNAAMLALELTEE